MTLANKILRLEPVNLFDYVKEIPELIDLKNTEQDRNWHAEGDVLIHTNMVLEKALPLAHKVAEKNKNIEDGISIYIGSLLHDFGKPYTTFNKKGRIVAYGHEGVGVSYAREFLRKYFPMYGFPRREWLLSLVEYHGHPKRLIATNSRDVRFKQLSLEVNTEQVYNVEVADFTGRTGDSPEKYLAMLEQFKEKCIDLNIWDKKYVIPNSNYMSNKTYRNHLWQILFNHVREGDKKAELATLNKMGDTPFELMILCGPPGSGKSTYRNTLFPHVEAICMDDERERLCGDASDMSKNQEVFDLCYKRLVNNLRARKNTIWDATSITRKHRKRLIDIARRLGAMVSIVVFDLPIYEILNRNQSRKRVVPEDVVYDFYRRFQSPKPYEYDKLYVVNENLIFDPVQKKYVEVENAKKSS